MAGEPRQIGNKRPRAAGDVVAFPSLEWFGRLAELMNANRSRQEQLGYVDCTAEFRVLDGAPGGRPLAYQVTFEEFAAVEVRQTDPASPADAAKADFALDATLATWRAMIESIARGSGRPDLDQTLNRLSHTGTPIRLRGADQLRKDCYFRFNQSLQEFFNASAKLSTGFEL